MDVVKLREKYNALIAEAKAKAEEWKGKEDEMPAEVAQAIDALLGQSDEIKALIITAEKLAENDAFMHDPAGTQAAHLGWRQSGPDEGNVEVDVKAWREIEIKRIELDPLYGVPVEVTRKMRYFVPLAVKNKDYPDAFEAYMHKGFTDMDSNDRKTLTEGTDSAGGFIVPEDYQAELIRKVAVTSTIRPNARVATTSRDIAKWPKINYTTDDQYTSGVRLTWTGESPASASTHRVTDPVFGLYSIPVHTAMASMPLSNDLLEDSAFDVMGISSDLLSEAFALGENNVFINGTGIAQPMGILTQVDGDGPASVVSGTAATLLAGGIIDLAYALPEQYERNAKWFFRKATEKVIRKLADTTGNYLWPIIPQAGNFGVVPRELLGFPVIRESFVPAVGTNTYPIIFGDMNGYLVLDRVGLSVQRLSELYAETNITLLLARKRVGGQTIEPWRLRVQKVSA